jgi:signal transduction histidine kinase
MDSTNPIMGPQARQAAPPAPPSPPAPSAPDGAWRGILAPGRAPEPHARRKAILLSLPRVLVEPFSPAAWRAAWQQSEYIVLSLLLAIPGFVFIVVALTVGFGLSLSFAGMLVGLPLLMVALLGARELGALHRRLAGRLLGVRVESPPALRPRSGIIGRVQARLTDPVGWRACAYLLLKLPLSVLTVILAGYLLFFGLPYLTFPLWWEILHVNGIVIHVPGWIAWWKADPLLVAGDVHSLAVSFALVPAGVVGLAWAPWATKGANDADARLVARLLGPSMPHRMRELEQTRSRLVDDSAARLRAIERDLHDGAQAQMVAVAMKLGLAREKLGGPVTEITAVDIDRARELVDAAHRGAKEAIIELRDLARGIHPPVLDHGLGTALTTLAARSDVPVELVIDLPERPSAAIETIAYFCAAELLTNVAKHSGARHATVEVVHVPGLLRVRVSDAGSGGARVEARGGLAGLAERVRSVDGRLQVSSPPHGPTVVTVELPSHA